MTKDITGTAAPRRQKKGQYRNEEPACKEKRGRGRPRRLVVPSCQEIQDGKPCGGPVVARSLCWRCLQRFYRHGNTKTVLKPGVKVKA